MEFKQIQNLFGEDGQIKWTIVYGVCRAQKAFDWMEIRAVLEALRMKGIKEIYIGYHEIYSFFKCMILKNKVNSVLLVVVVLLDPDLGHLSSDAQTKNI